MDPTNPYAAYAPPAPPIVYRQNVFVPPGASTAPLLGPGLRNAKLVLGIVQTLAIIVGVGLLFAGVAVRTQTGDGAGLLMAGGVVFAFWNLTFFAYALLSMVWAYKFWSWIPPEHRHMSLWKSYVSPMQATLFMLIPLFGVFWIIALNLGTAEILDRMRVAYPSNKPSAKNTAIIASVIPFVFFPAGPFVDYFFDRHVEGIAADMQAQMTAAVTPAGVSR